MNKIKFFQFLALGLLITNLLLIGFMFFNRPHPPQQDGPKGIIVERLHFDEQQKQEFAKLIEAHQPKIKAIDVQINEVKKVLYRGLNVEAFPAKDSLENVLGNLQVQIEDLHFNHFLDIKKLCKPEQKPYFEELTNELAQLFGRQAKQKPPPQP